MLSLQEWKKLRESEEQPEDETPSADDFNFYRTNLSGTINKYLNLLISEVEKGGQKLTTIRKGFIVQKIMDALGLTPQQVVRMSSNISNAMKQNPTPQTTPPVQQGGVQ